MFSSMRVILGTAAGAALLTGAAVSAPALASQHTAGSTAARASGTPRCLTSKLSGALHGQQVGLGNRGMILTLTNNSNASCSVDGYAGLGLEDASHKVLTSHTHWGGTYFDNDPGKHLIVLSPGETVSADMAFSDGTGTPQGVTATYLEVTPPNDFKHLTIKFPGGPADVFNGNLFVTAFARHTQYG